MPIPMIEGWDPTEIIACAIRPQGSWLHLVTLLGFVLATFSVSPAMSPAPMGRAPARVRAGS